MSEAKRELIRLIKKQPADGNVEDVVNELVFHMIVLRGLEDVRAGRLIPHEEVVREIQKLAGEAWVK